MKKPVHFTVLCILLCLALSVSAGAARFSDIAGHPHEKAILRAVSEGIINGYDDGTFRPSSSVTRAEFCAMLNRTLGITGYSVLSFDDVALSDWYFEDVRNAVTAGYIVGMPDNRFVPGGSITRYQCALMLSRIAKFSGSSIRLSYSDAGNVPEWARNGVAFAQTSGVFSAFVGSSFEGQKILTRAQTASVLVALLDYLDKLPVFFSLVSANDHNKPLDTKTLYRNEYSSVSFVICGRNLAQGYGFPEKPGSDTYLTALDAARTRLVRDLSFAITGAIGINTLSADGSPTESPSYTYFSCPDENTFLITIIIDRADYLPAWLSAAVKLPHDGALASSYTMRNSAVFVKYTAIGEYCLAAENPRIVHRAVLSDSGSYYLVRRYLSWVAHPNAEEYTVEFYVCNADGEIIESSRVGYDGQYSSRDGRVEIDIADYVIADPAARYGNGAYQVVSVSAESSSNSVSFYKTDLPLSAGSYVRLTLDGRDVSSAAVIRDDGVSLELSNIRFAALTGLPAASITCDLEITILDADFRDVTADFALDGSLPLGENIDITSGIRADAMDIGTLTTTANTGFYTLVLQFDIEDVSGNIRTLYLTGALVVE
ncbi:MAG: S-layer homology domain-containing protein [Clostridiaceae bacterium]|nr:S-layer homology domain-containing protein [Clostridiaceae bacterium]